MAALSRAPALLGEGAPPPLLAAPPAEAPRTQALHPPRDSCPQGSQRVLQARSLQRENRKSHWVHFCSAQ